MVRRTPRIALTLALLVVAGLVVLIVAARPGLQDDVRAMDRSWRPLVAPLTRRYQALGAVARALTAAGAGQRAGVKELGARLSDWDLQRVTTDFAAQARLANTLESLAARERAAVARADRLRADPGITTAYTAFEAVRPDPALVRRYNGAVDAYEHARTRALNRIVASLDGDDARPTLQIVTS